MGPFSVNMYLQYIISDGELGRQYHVGVNAKYVGGHD